MQTDNNQTDWIPWFQKQLRASGDGFVWALSQIPPSFHDQLPPAPDYMGSWTPLRHVWHVTEYERCLALPSMKAWPGIPLPQDTDWPDDDDTWTSVKDKSSDALITAFKQVRQQEIDLLDQLGKVDWLDPQETLWGERPLAWIITKTFQHTYEHGDTLLRMGLWWEHILREMSKARTESEG